MKYRSPHMEGKDSLDQTVEVTYRLWVLLRKLGLKSVIGKQNHVRPTAYRLYERCHPFPPARNN